MSVNPVATSQWSAVAKKAGEPGPAPARSFEEVLSGTASPGKSEPVSAATAAEILRLKMLSSALNIGGDQEASSATSKPLGVQGLLNKFLAQLPEGAATGADAAGSAVEGAGRDDVAGSLESAAAAGDPLFPSGSTDAIIDKASRRYGVDAGLIKAVIKAESDFNPRAVSSAGAQGLMQLMPATARGLGVSDAFDPEQNVMAGTRFLKDMLRRYDGNVDQALAAYNWGPGNVDRHGSSAMPRETRVYLGKVKSYYAQYVG